jgi:LysM repeat protein
LITRVRAGVALAVAVLTTVWMLIPNLSVTTESPGEQSNWSASAPDDIVGRIAAVVEPRDDSSALFARLDARDGGPSESLARSWPAGAAAPTDPLFLSWPPVIDDPERVEASPRLAPGAPTPTPAPEYYTVVAGDTLSDIAESLGVSANQFAQTNNLGDGAMLGVGQRLIVPPRPNAVHRVVRPSRAATLVPRFIWPVTAEISTYFGEPGAVWIGGKHSGLDLAAREGVPIAAASAGLVIEAGWSTGRGFGNFVMIDHGMGFRTIYGHMSKIVATAGQTVKRGDLIGYVGDTGVSFGPHLHFEVNIEGVAVDPLNYLP